MTGLYPGGEHEVGRKAGTEVGVNNCLVALIANESVSIALSRLLLPPEVGVNRHGQTLYTSKISRPAVSSYGVNLSYS